MKSSKEFIKVIKHNGLTIERIAKRYGITPAAVRKSLDEYCSLSERKQKAFAKMFNTTQETLCGIASGRLDFLDYLALSTSNH